MLLHTLISTVATTETSSAATSTAAAASTSSATSAGITSIGSLNYVINSQINLAVFMMLFMICAIEVVFIKVITTFVDDFNGSTNSSGTASNGLGGLAAADGETIIAPAETYIDSNLLRVLFHSPHLQSTHPSSASLWFDVN